VAISADWPKSAVMLPTGTTKTVLVGDVYRPLPKRSTGLASSWPSWMVRESMETSVGAGEGVTAVSVRTADPAAKSVATSAQTDRRPNGQFAVGNRCGRRHGKRSTAAVLRRKQGAVARKLAAMILAKLDLLPAYRCRPRPLRADQVQHLDREAMAVIVKLGTLRT
jgi:hypothetical protein